MNYPWRLSIFIKGKQNFGGTIESLFVLFCPIYKKIGNKPLE
jgi:hypothetical protein